jgi:hypothetical protein
MLSGCHRWHIIVVHADRITQPLAALFGELVLLPSIPWLKSAPMDRLSEIDVRNCRQRCSRGGGPSDESQREAEVEPSCALHQKLNGDQRTEYPQSGPG